MRSRSPFPATASCATMATFPATAGASSARAHCSRGRRRSRLRSDSLGCQPRIREVETIHDLVVVVARRRTLVAGKGVRVGALEVDEAPAFFVEERMMDGIVK